MKILFIQGGSRLKQDTEGNWYTDPNFNDDVWKRYVDLADSLTILLRRERKIYTKEYALQKFNKVLDDSRIRIVPLVDFTESKLSMLNPFVYKEIKRVIFAEVQKVDKCFIRSGSHYTRVAYDACIKYHKPYLFEATGFAYESFSHHSLIGRIIANKVENDYRLMARDAVQATYVTSEALQKRYPCASGKMIGVSNVQLSALDDSILTKRLKKIQNRQSSDTLVLGTAAFLDVKWKGQYLVIKALAELKRQGYTNFRYELLGMGTGQELIKLAESLGVKDEVKVIGAVPHSKVFEWLDSLDMYIQPSFQEGLCRAIIEAMSRGLPVVCSNTGGNYELIDNDYIFDCGDYNKMSSLLIDIQDHLSEQSKKNFEESKKYEKSMLDSRRKAFFREFVNM